MLCMLVKGKGVHWMHNCPFAHHAAGSLATDKLISDHSVRFGRGKRVRLGTTDDGLVKGGTIEQMKARKKVTEAG
jgi:hypothetical protein